MSTDKELTKDEIVDAIARLWNPLTKSQRQALKENISVKYLKKKDLIYNKLETPTDLICLLQGKVKVYKEALNGRNQIVRIIKPIDFFGYRAYFANEYYKTSAKAFEPSTVAFIPMRFVIQLIKENFHIGFFIINRLSKELGTSDERIINLTQKHIRGRLAETLIYLRDNYGVEPDGVTLSIRLRREDIADLSNMTTSNVIRTLSTFSKEHLIETKGRSIKILNENALSKISKIG